MKIFYNYNILKNKKKHKIMRKIILVRMTCNIKVRINYSKKYI